MSDDDLRLLWVKAPWISLIELGLKPLECRSKPTPYRGPVLLCASLTLAKGGYADEFACWGHGPLGVTRALGELVDCRRITAADVHGALPVQRLMGPLERADVAACWGGYVWEFRHVRRVERVPLRGRRGLVRPTADDLARLPLLTAA